MHNFFMFATGIENSYPTINNGRTRIDQMQKTKHYELWKKDFDLVQELNISFLRYGPPIYRVWIGPGKYDWSFTDLVFEDLKQRNIMPICDLCHFGVPDWIGNFQNSEFPLLFSQYAYAFACRYPWVQLYTPINEMLICATFSALYGWWNEQEKSDRAFVTALKHVAKANILAMESILKIRPDAIFIQSESSEYYHADNPEAIRPAEIMNEKRFLSLDLNYGRRVNSEMYEYLLDNGMTRDEYHFFMNHNLKHHCIMGNDYYTINEHRVSDAGLLYPAGEVFGYDELTLQYYGRYLLPVMYTETNANEGPLGTEAVDWLWKQWANVLQVRNKGIPIVGFTWYSLIDQIDWDTSLREENNRINPLGLYDIHRHIRAVGKSYKELMNSWKEILPTQSVCLQVPIVGPCHYHHPTDNRNITSPRSYHSIERSPSR